MVDIFVVVEVAFVATAMMAEVADDIVVDVGASSGRGRKPTSGAWTPLIP